MIVAIFVDSEFLEQLFVREEEDMSQECFDALAYLLIVKW